MRLQYNRRLSNVGGGWGVQMMHADRHGHAVLVEDSSWRTWHGVMVQMPGHRWLFVWRRGA